MSDRLFSQSTGMFIAETHTDAVTWHFSVDRFRRLQNGEVADRVREFREMTAFETHVEARDA